ncbi:MAG: alpha/beta fold hydrolase [Candidatus Binatia bacterium]
MSSLSVGDTHIHYEQTGSGTDLVLIHGLGGDLHMWDRAAPLFARYHRVLRYDVRGFGASGKPPGPYSASLFARDLHALLVACDVRYAHIAGCSMGGVIAQRFALDYGALVRSLVLVSTSSEVGPAAAARWQRLAERLEQEGFSARTADMSHAFAPGFADRNPTVGADVNRRTAANDPRTYAAAARAMGTYGWTAELPRLTAPTLIVQGLHDQLTPPGGSVRMSRALPHARLLMIADAGHSVPVEQPEVFQHALLAFTAGVDLVAASTPPAPRR